MATWPDYPAPNLPTNARTLLNAIIARAQQLQWFDVKSAATNCRGADLTHDRHPSRPDDAARYGDVVDAYNAIHQENPNHAATLNEMTHDAGGGAAKPPKKPKQGKGGKPK